MELKQKKSGIFFLEFEELGTDGAAKRTRISLETRDPAEARKQKIQWQSGVHAKQLAGRAAPTNILATPSSSEPTGWTVRKALNKCELTVWKRAKAWTSIMSNVKIVNSYVGNELVADMNYMRIERLIAQMEGDGYAPGTIKRKLDTLSKAVSMSSVWTDPVTGKPYITGKPKWPHLKFDNTKDRELSSKEEEAVFAAIDERIRTDPQKPWWRFKALYRVLLETGLRLSEALAMDDEHLTTEQALDPATGDVIELVFHNVRREEAKNGRPRIVPLTEAVLELRPLLSMQAAGGRWFPFKPGGAWQMWDYIRKELGAAGMDLSDVVLHTLRHTCASRMRRRGVGIDHIQLWLGHSDIAITAERYVHSSGADLAAAAGLTSNRSKTTNSQSDSGSSAIREVLASTTNRDNLGTAHLH